MNHFIEPYAQLAATAEAAEGEEGILEGLGIDFTLLVLQAIAFLLLVWILGKFVYPKFFKIIEERQQKIDESLQAAREAEDSANSAQEKIDKQLKESRKEAREIIATAKDEANDMLARADEKAKANAEHVLVQARDEIAKETIAAKRALHNETIELVALATEKVVAQKLDKKADAGLITRALKEADN